jgi:glycerol-3-phosphate acyltransferase PlsY
MTAPFPVVSAAIALVLGYFLGAIPFGLLFSHLAGAGDVRKIGSGNIGATNVLRTGKKWAAAATLLCDGGKGAAAVLLARYFLPPGAEIFAALAAVLGHLFPIWLGFRGGKGVATFLGGATALAWPVGLAAMATWAAAALIWRISSLSALIAIGLSPLYFFFFGPREYVPLAVALAVMIFFTHRENIRRLFLGKEPHIGANKSANA